MSKGEYRNSGLKIEGKSRDQENLPFRRLSDAWGIADVTEGTDNEGFLRKNFTATFAGKTGENRRGRKSGRGIMTEAKAK